MAWGPFFQSPRPIGMDLDDGAVHRCHFELHAHELFPLQLLEDPIQHPALRPATHPCVDGVPVAKARRQSSPFAAMFGHVQDGVEHLQIRQTDVAALHREVWRDAFVLSLSKFHP